MLGLQAGASIPEAPLLSLPPLPFLCLSVKVKLIGGQAYLLLVGRTERCSSQQVGCRPGRVDRSVVFRTPEVVSVMDLTLDIIDDGLMTERGIIW